MGTIHLSVFVLLCLGISRLSSEILQRQKRNWIIDSFTIDEGYEGPFPYYLDKISVEKTLTLFKISGQGVDKEPKDTLEINSSTGEITVKRPVDYEQFNELKLVFQALDKESHVIDTQLGIEIQIIDSNDNPPKFDQELYEITIEESKSQGTGLIIIKATDADSGNNKIFDLRIVSVTPKPEELEFYLNQINGDQIGTISFKGCLDHEKTEKYTIIVEAKDRGEKKQLSSSCTVVINIEDGNNHFPVITRQTGPGSVKEGQKNVLVSRLHTTDADTKGTAAWRVKYQIQGDTNNYFSITTDPETNDGLLYVEKKLDYEGGSQRNVTISVQNEIPYHSCKVVRRTTTGLWTVTTSTVIITGATTGVGIGAGLPGSSTYQVTVTVEDVNEPPIFDEPNKRIQLLENVDVGRYLVTFTARDPDVTSANTFVYKKGEDPADWVTVDPNTGKITTSNIIDRESVFVKDSIYVVTIYAVDNGVPPMTSTATLTIHVTDSNDNAPFLNSTIIDICQSASDVPSKANITAVDLDEVPYGGPFTFKLQGNVEGKWKVDPVQGYSVNLVKDGTVYSGHYELLLEVSDLQGIAAVHNLSVTVCNCLDAAMPNCRLNKSTGSKAGGSLLIPFFILLAIAGMLLLISLVSCEKQQIKIPDDDAQQHMIGFNIERPGTDCKVAFDPSNQGNSKTGQRIKKKQGASNTKFTSPPTANASVGYVSSGYGMSQTDVLQQRNNLHWLIADSLSEETQARVHYSQSQRKSTEHTSSLKKSMHWGASSATRVRNLHGGSKHASWAEHSKYSGLENNVIQREFQLQVLKKMLYTLQAPGKELGDYAPHVYAEEGEAENSFELDAISISDISFDPDLDWDMDFKFRTLASICTPGDSTAYSTKTSCVFEKLQTATLIQVESHKTKMNTQLHL
ncbi:cadherin-13 isoform X2 [Toxotes jaculatrix]|uniref:cadherin-13 isoform X2 n=1 Tax=Toxotes jaculatrix TaxID=941984 RepID=UPI001B3A8BAF|nr:cadherin-13 isoform X2 [Toxotes jaculatrix]